LFVVLHPKLLQNSRGGHADQEQLVSLSNLLLEFVGGNNSRDTGNIYVGLVLKEWLNNNGVPLNSVDRLVLAFGHVEYYRRRNVFADSYHLHRARTLFEQHIDEIGGLDNELSSRTLHCYCKVLQFLGELKAASEVAVVLMSNFESDPYIADFVLMAGAIQKSLENFEEANSLFFDACQLGPSGFSKIEIMTIISRNLEEMGADGGDSNDDAFKMVHSHLVAEGLVDEDVDYEDW
jgi:hypothetical protein